MPCELQSCVSVVLDFLSPENVTECIQLIDELRQLPENHKAKVDSLEVNYTWRLTCFFSTLVHVMNMAFTFVAKTRWRKWRCTVLVELSKKFVSLHAQSKSSLKYMNSGLFIVFYQIGDHERIQDIHTISWLLCYFVHEIYQVSMVWIRCSVIIYLKQTSSRMGNIACIYV